jgi:ligand-binding SRPBCC domain-containing protein
MPTFTTELFLTRSVDEVFGFFSDAANLNLLTPPWLHFRILTPLPVPMRCGTLLDYRIRWRRVPLRWRTQISVWEPPHRFVDQQLAGPYRRWEHEHTFEERDGGTLLRDRVEYDVYGWLLAPLLIRWLVGPDLRRIFDYRQQRMKQLFGGEGAATSPGA